MRTKMKTFLAVFWNILLALPANAYDFNVDGLYYTILGANSVSVVKASDDGNIQCDYVMGDLTIPSTVTYNGKPYSVTTIGERAFENCDALKSVTIPSSVTSIGDYAFCNCTGLTSVTIPNSVTAIGNYAFNRCTSLTSVTIPNSVTTIGSSAFEGCTVLTSLKVASDNPKYDSRDNCNAIIETASNTLITGCSNTSIPGSVTAIGNYAFNRCTSLTSVAIPNSVITIGDYAFYNCSVTSVTLPSSVTSIGDYAFSACRGLTSLTIPNSVTSIGDHAFSNCDALKSVTIPSSVTTIGDGAFGFCSGLISIVVESGNKNYDSRNNCNAIVETATNTLIACCNSTTIPSSVTTIGNYAFSACRGLTSLTIPNSVTAIGNYAIAGCTGLTSVTIPNSVTSIGDYAFYNCTGLTSVTIPNSVTTIGSSAFKGCTGLTSVTIPNSVTSIGQSVFIECTGLTSVTIPNSVTSIGDFAFTYCTGLTSVTIPNSVISIGRLAFEKCTGLSSVTIGNSVTTIDERAFLGCTSLTSMAFPGSVTSIGRFAFGKCTGLSSVTIPSSITTIGEYAFYECSGLANIYSLIQNPNLVSLGNGVFGGVHKADCLLKVPSASLDLYRNAAQWKEFSNIITDITATSISLNKNQLQLFQGQKETLLATVLPANAFNKVAWTSNNTSVATVDQNGVVTAVADGNATIMATTVDGSNLSASCPVEVTVPVSSISLSQTSASINQNSTLMLAATVLPANATNKTLTWTSNDNVVAIVDQNGLVTAKSPGVVTITAASNDGTGVTASCVITVGIPVTSIQISQTSANIYQGGSLSLKANTIPTNATNRVLYWSSSNPDVASVDQNGRVAANTIGTATITAATTDGSNLNASCEVTVTGITKITLNKTTTSLFVDDSETLTAAVAPSDVINKMLKWSSSDTSVATVNQYGTVTAEAVGAATITATATDGSGVSASCEVVVLPEYGIDIKPNVAHVRGTDHRTHELVVGMSNREPIAGLQFVMTLPEGVSPVSKGQGDYDVWLDVDRKGRNHSVSLEPLANNSYLVLISSPTNRTFSGNNGDILQMNVLIDQYHEMKGDQPIVLSNVVMAEADEKQHTAANAQSTVRLSYLVGDANADVQVDVADYVVTANCILGRDTGAHFFTDAANAYYYDSKINVTDLVAITNIALELRTKEIYPGIDGFQFAPALTTTALDFALSAALTESNNDKRVVTLGINNDTPLAAMQFDLDLPAGMKLKSIDVAERARGLNASIGISPDGKTRVVLSSFGTEAIDGCCGDVLTLILSGKVRGGDHLRITNAVMTERDLTEHGAAGDLSIDLAQMTSMGTVTYDHVNIYGSNGMIVIESPIAGTASLVRANGMGQAVTVQPGYNTYPVSVTRGDIIIVTFNGTTKKLQF